MELSLKMVGRKYKEIGDDERTTLELEANRFQSTYPLPGEEEPIYEDGENGDTILRMPLKIVHEEGEAKIDINNKLRIDPVDFITLYTNKLVNHAQDSTGLEVNYQQ